MVFEDPLLSCAAYLFGGLAKDRIAARYRRASLTDPLTGVANRLGFFQTGERLLMRVRFARQPAALLMFGLDRFKDINDTYGHQAGDAVLRAFCRLADVITRGQTIFLAGSEVRNSRACCLLRGGKTPSRLAERVRAFEAAHHTVGEQRLAPLSAWASQWRVI